MDPSSPVIDMCPHACAGFLADARARHFAVQPDGPVKDHHFRTGKAVRQFGHKFGATRNVVGGRAAGAERNADGLFALQFGVDRLPIHKQRHFAGHGEGFRRNARGQFEGLAKRHQLAIDNLAVHGVEDPVLRHLLWL